MKKTTLILAASLLATSAAALTDSELKALSEEIITLTCPRCGARYRAAREQFEAWKERA